MIPYVRSKTVLEHNTYKKNILDAINSIGSQMKNDLGNTLSRTDWQLPSDYPREYLDYFFKILDPFMKEFSEEYFALDWNVRNIWFQQYGKEDIHEWHNHPAITFTNIYFLELSDSSIGTEIYDPLENKIYQIECKEGDIISFPGYVIHRSPKNLTDTRKTVIVFNCDLIDISYEKINKLLKGNCNARY